MRKRILFIFLPALVLMSCGGNTKQVSYFEEAIPVTISVMGQDSNSNFRNYVGTVGSELEMPLSFQLGGTLTGLYVHNGQTVKKGALMARVDETSARSLHEAALATLRQAEDGYERLKQVHEEGGISEVRWVQMETDLEKARQSEISTRKHLEDCSLYAPCAGVVSIGDYHVGEQLNPSSPFCKILDMNKLQIEFSVPESEITLVSKGDKANVIIPALENMPLEVEVTDKALLANPMGHTYTVKARVTSKPEKSIMPGMVAKIQLFSTARAGLVVPTSCIQTMPDGISVWVLEQGKAYRRHIEVADFVKNGVQVSEGLNEGDTIVTFGYQKLYNGASVSF